MLNEKIIIANNNANIAVNNNVSADVNNNVIDKNNKKVKLEINIYDKLDKPDNKIKNSSKNSNINKNSNKNNNKNEQQIKLDNIKLTDKLNFTEDQVSEFTYIFTKTIEARNLNHIFSSQNFLKEFSSKDKELPTKLANKIINTLKM